MADEEADLGEGICTNPRVQVRSDFNASKDMLSFNTCPSAASAPNVIARKLPLKQAPTKKADRQVQAIDLSRECRNLEFEQLLDGRVAELGQKLMGSFSEMLDSRVESRLAALEYQAAQRPANENNVARDMGEEFSALGSQIQLMNARVSKITGRPAVRIEHLTALEERVIALDRSLSELRCEYLEGCLRSHQMEELVIALHSSVRDLRASSQSESKLANMACDGGSSSSRRQLSALNGTTSGCLPRLETISEAEVVLAQSPEGMAAEDIGSPPESSTAEPEPETEDCNAAGWVPSECSKSGLLETREPEVAEDGATYHPV